MRDSVRERGNEGGKEEEGRVVRRERRRDGESERRREERKERRKDGWREGGIGTKAKRET